MARDVTRLDVVLREGVRGGQSISGGQVAGDALTLRATRTDSIGTIYVQHPVVLDDALTGTPVVGYNTLLTYGGTVTVSGGLGSFRFVAFTGIIRHPNPPIVNNHALFHVTGRVEVASGSGLPPFAALFDQTTFFADAVSLSAGTPIGFAESTTFTCQSGGNFGGTVGRIGFQSAFTVAGGVTVPIRRGVYVLDTTVSSGVLATQVGIDIASLTTASSENLSLRSGGPNAQMRHAGSAVFGSSTTSAAAHLHVIEPSSGTAAFRLETVALTDDPMEEVYQASLVTSGSTAGNLQNIPVNSGYTYAVEARVVMRRLGGATGAAGDGGFFIRAGMFRCIGSASLVGSVQNIATAVTSTGYVATLAGSLTTLGVVVTGLTTQNLIWHTTTRVQRVGT